MHNEYFFIWWSYRNKSDGQPIAPDLVLAYRGGTKQGIIHNVQSLTNKNDLAQAAEITFDVYKKVNNVTCELWNDIRDFRLVYIPHLDTASFNPWYELSVETDEDDATKTLSRCPFTRSRTWTA